MRHPLGGLVMIVAATVTSSLSRPAAAQWGITLEVQRATYGGTSRDTSTGGTGGSFRPGNSPALTLRLDRRFGRMAIGIGVRYSRSAVVLDNRALFVGIRNQLSTIEFAPEVRVRIAQAARGAGLHFYGGPVIGVSDLQGHGSRVIPGASVGIAGELPIVERLALWVRIGGGVAPSLFRPGDLPPEFERHLARRSEIALGLRYGR
jgi:hypothetical protein